MKSSNEVSDGKTRVDGDCARARSDGCAYLKRVVARDGERRKRYQRYRNRDGDPDSNSYGNPDCDPDAWERWRKRDGDPDICERRRKRDGNSDGDSNVCERRRKRDDNSDSDPDICERRRKRDGNPDSDPDVCERRKRDELHLRIPDPEPRRE